jgi:hypothetical protein
MLWIWQWQTEQRPPNERQGAHRAVSAEAAEAGSEDGAADEGGVAAHHVHDAAASEVDGAAAEQQMAVLPASSAAPLCEAATSADGALMEVYKDSVLPRAEC